MAKSAKKSEKKEVKKMGSDVKCDPKHAFIAMDGATFKSIKELCYALEMMSDDTYYYHVNQNKNDFCNWIRDVFGEKDLAEKMLRAKSKEKAMIVILKWMLEKN